MPCAARKGLVFSGEGVRTFFKPCHPLFATDKFGETHGFRLLAR